MKMVGKFVEREAERWTVVCRSLWKTSADGWDVKRNSIS